MIERIIEFCLKNRFLVIAASLLIIGSGIYAINKTPVDAIPDIGENQIIVFADWPGRSPKDVEDQVIYPLTINLLGIPGVKVIRSNSMFSFGFVNILFEEGIDFYWARTRVLERLNWAQKDLPEDVIPVLGPDATALGQVFWYTVENGFYCPEHPQAGSFDAPGKCPIGGEPLVASEYDLAQLRSLQDWYIRYQLNAVSGVSEVASVGGYVREYQVDVDPNKLLAYNVGLHHVFNAVRNSNIDVGAKVLEEAGGGMEFIIRGLGFIKSVEDIENIVVGQHGGTPIYVKNIAKVTLGAAFRRGALEKNGQKEVTGGVVLMRYGENPLKIIEGIKKKIEEIKPGLPPGVRIIPFYDRTGLIKRAISTLKTSIAWAIIIAAVVILAFLGHILSSTIISLILPLGILLCFLVMFIIKVPSNIMSLGGIALAIGVMVDAGIVMTENIFRRLNQNVQSKNKLIIAMDAAKEVGPAIFFSMLIIITAFTTIFTLRGQSGKLFRPLAVTTTSAMGASALLSITIIPVLASLILKGGKSAKRENILTYWLKKAYEPIVKFSLNHKALVIFIAVAFLLVSLIPLSLIKSEFMPPLNEGDLLFMPVLLPGASLTQVMEVMKKQNSILSSFPEVNSAVGKLGRAETATDPAPVGMIETIVSLKDRKYWRKGMNRQRLIKEMDKALRMPGVSNIWTQPIRNRIDMLATGIQTPIGIKVFGSDLEKIENIAIQIENLLKEIPGALNPYAERIGNKPYVEVEIDRQQAARYGIKVGDIQHVIMTAIGGMKITTTVEGRERYPVRVRYLRELRDNVDALNRIFVPAPGGGKIPLSQLARVVKRPGPAKIASENTLPYVRIFADVDTEKTGIIDFVNHAQRIVKDKVKLPPGYYVSWSGQYEYEMQSRRRLLVIVPLCVFLILMLLYIRFRSLSAASILIFALPFAFTGGIWLQFLLGYKFSTAVWVGYIALFGIAVEAGVVMMDFLLQVYRRQAELKGVQEAVVEASLLRVRPIVMTTATTVFALFAVMFSTGAGSEVMKPIAAPTVGGLITATLLNLIIVPVLFTWTKERSAPKEEAGI
jgi:Cu(I)/Ag(I) efflux system membrane protein CusA/SilA